jgi:hypothetical protein
VLAWRTKWHLEMAATRSLRANVLKRTLLLRARLFAFRCLPSDGLSPRSFLFGCWIVLELVVCGVLSSLRRVGTHVWARA